MWEKLSPLNMPFKKVSERKTSITYINIQNLEKNGIDELTCKAKIGTHMQRINVRYQGGKVEWGGLGG